MLTKPQWGIYNILHRKCKKMVEGCENKYHYQATLQYIKLAKNKMYNILHLDDRKKYHFKKYYIEKDFGVLERICLRKKSNN